MNCQVTLLETVYYNTFLEETLDSRSLISSHLLSIFLLGSLSFLLVRSLCLLIKSLPHFPHLLHQYISANILCKGTHLGNISNLVIWVGSLDFCSLFTWSERCQCSIVSSTHLTMEHTLEDEVGRERSLGSIGILLGTAHLATSEVSEMLYHTLVTFKRQHITAIHQIVKRGIGAK